ncbi:disease resistance protein RPV1-like [Apium graveolens]|uniref:disease resistance protein RPV1-like n=1 Tax=Apium graveolens TaxID=4045 RepID=UPI003D7BFC5F
MATTTSSQLATHSSSSSPLAWDVFLSFYGKDTRGNFIANLYYALDQAGVQTFRDDPALRKGEQISLGLRNAIKSSKKFVVVISENYARSSWCLTELVEILDCQTTKNQVIPVFYYTDPSDLRHQTGSFRDALDYHKKRYSDDMIDKWKSALATIAGISGYHLRKDTNENESDTIQEILENVSRHASKNLLHLDELFGIDSAMEEIYEKLRLESNDVRAIGICGMGGIGKTTTAKAFYNKYYKKFDVSCFIEDIKQNSQGLSPLLLILKQLSMELVRRKDYVVLSVESGIRQLKQILSSRKALIVLDDLDQSSYWELLVRLSNSFSVGSRIIITTRDANLLNQLKIDMAEVDVYMVKELGQLDSLKLFSYYAFGKQMLPESFRELSVGFVAYAKGLPLALKVLGSSLRGRTKSTDMSFWKAKLKKVRKIPESGIHEILKLSYEELDDETYKALFLDIAFFFVGRKKDEAVPVFKSCKFFPDIGIPILAERCLLTIDEDNKFRMHSLIQDMGRELAKNRHLLCRGDAWEDLQNLEGKDNIEGLILDLSTSNEREVRAKIFKKMPSLRLLEIVNASDIKGSFNNSFCELRCFRWINCPWTRLPSSFGPQKLVSLHLPFSKLKKLWKSIKPIKQLTNLGCLDLKHCCNFKRFPEQMGELKRLKILDASYTAIEELPDSIAHLKKLVKLDLYQCKKLRKLPENFGNMEGLREFDASYSAIELLPDSFISLSNLVNLTLYCCKNLTSLPNGSTWNLNSLEYLNLQYCSKLKRLSDQLGDMQCLKVLDASFSAIEELPDSIGQLSVLQDLNVGSCKKLKYVPKSIWNLTSLKQIYLFQNDIHNLPDTVKDMKLEGLGLRCNVRLWMPVIAGLSSLKRLHLTDEGGSLSLTKLLSLSTLSNLQDLLLDNCASLGSSFPELPTNLRILVVCNNASLEQLPNLVSLQQLKYLTLSRCINLQSLPLLPPCLRSLEVCECTGLKNQPDLSMLKELEILRFVMCSNLISVDLNQMFLQKGLIGGQFMSCPFKATLPNREIAEWFDYKSRGSAVSFDFPPVLEDKFLGLALWVVYTCIDIVDDSYITVAITNKAEGLTVDCDIFVHARTKDVIQSSIVCTTVNKILAKKGDTIEVMFQSSLYPYSHEDPVAFASGEVKVERCGAHLIQKTCL